jgi:hypothetical protein
MSTLGWDRLFTALTGVAAALSWAGCHAWAPKSPVTAGCRLCAVCCATSPTLPRPQPAGSALSPRDLAERLAVMAAIEEGLDPHAAGSAAFACQCGRCRLINTQISALLWLRDSTGKTITRHSRLRRPRPCAAALEQAKHAARNPARTAGRHRRHRHGPSAAAGWGHAERNPGHIGLALQAHL